MSRTHTSTAADGKQQYYLITNVAASNSSTNEVDLHAKAWTLPYTIDDSDLTFDGTPLNMLYEENKYMAEHSSRGRGRSRQKK